MSPRLILLGMLLFGVSVTAGAVDPESVSIQDLRPECKERHPSVPPEHCTIDDRLPAREYARRFGGTVIVVEPDTAAGSPVLPSRFEAGAARLPATPR